MKFPFFASFIVFLIWLAYELKKHNRISKKELQSFWDRESAANATRKKSLEYLSYITIPLEELPMNILTEDETIQEIHQIVTTLSTQKVVNLTGFSNTDLKLQYGAPNLSLLTEYDQNYTLLARTLQKWATILYEHQYVTECQKILEFAVETRTDISKTYKLLADIYFSEGSFEKIQFLLEVANTLNSAMKSTIVRTLKESYLYND